MRATVFSCWLSSSSLYEAPFDGWYSPSTNGLTMLSESNVRSPVRWRSVSPLYIWRRTSCWEVASPLSHCENSDGSFRFTVGVKFNKEDGAPEVESAGR